MAIHRLEEIAIGRAQLLTPVFFPSISSVKTALRPAQYLAILHSLRDLNRCLLVSAFDLCRSSESDDLAQLLTTALEAGVNVLMDSGNYESYWKDEQSTWHQSDFHNILQRFSCTFAFGFDEQNPPMDVDAHVQLVVERWAKDQAPAGNRLIVPIVHGDSASLPTLCARVTQVPMVSVAERRLGEGVFERARSVAMLREALDKTGRYVGLHLLGTGNPISIALYAWAGADSFDGLEWCQTVVDHETGLLFHLSQSDFFRQQTGWDEENFSFQGRTLAHNLAFYLDWMHRLRKAVHGGDAIRFFRFNFPQRVLQRCAKNFGWEDSA